ncbi:MAG: class 1 isoprenoid biosynthesis enzyme [Xanthomonadales bacterium]|jgi:hypothetical protein|nr:class 1 isoprenoid biosynthesis enzyme [Xanthomonadales bacterium]
MQAAIDGAIQQLSERLDTHLPDSAAPIRQWMHALSAGFGPRAYFTHPQAFPTLALPHWAAESLGLAADPEFQLQLAYSSICGYYFIRMIDNVMDGEATLESTLLPALAFFHAEFQSVYQQCFALDSPFWPLFRSAWYGTAEAAMQDARSKHITLETFEAVSARKVRAALIPVGAVFVRQGNYSPIAAWSALTYQLGRWHQMENDLFDWYKDQRNGNQTCFLSAAEHRRDADESAMMWIVRTGFRESCDLLRGWIADTTRMAQSLGSEALIAYLDARAEGFEQRSRLALAGLGGLQRIARAMA